ncbi:MAG: hypothetical protein IPJ77_07125 [Planctomycetes bacterium]|nr:hypothetical protein [Planctomycetota bacterium]
MTTRFPLVLALVLAALPAAAQVHVLTVGPQGSQYADLQSAVDAAQDGDVLLVSDLPAWAPGPRVVIAGKDLTLVARGPGPVRAQALLVRDVPAGKHVLVQGITPLAPTAGGGGLALEDCAGAVRVVDAAFLPIDPLAPHSIEVRACADVEFANVDGLHGAATPPEPTLSVRSSRFVLSQSRVEGALGHPSSGGQPGASGGSAIGLRASELWLHGSYIHGGPGGSGASGGCPPLPAPTSGGDGGVGLVAGAGSIVHDRGAILEGGAAGVGGPGGACGAAPNGSVGVAVAVPAGVVQTDTAGTCSLFGPPRAVREVTSFDLIVSAPPGSAVFLLVGERAQLVDVPAIHGPLLVENTRGRFPIGITNGAGQVVLHVTVPQLPQGVQAARRFVQALALTPNGTVLSSGSRPLVFVDAVFW